MCPQIFSLTKCRLCFLIICVLSTITGFLFVILSSNFMSYVLNNNLILTPNSALFPLWKKFPIAYPLDVYLFNWTNPNDIYNHTIKPKFEQIGPYQFTESKANTNITWNQENGTVTYRHQKIWNYLGGDLENIITTVNPVALGAVHLMQNWHMTFLRTISMYITEISITRTANQMLFEGFSEPLLKVIKSLPFVDTSSYHDRFGWFYMRNGSTDHEGIYNMETGNSGLLGKLYQWNYWNQSPYFQGECAEFNDGSAGEFFQRNPSEILNLFSPNVCRMLTLKYVGESEVDGINGFKYALEPEMLDNGTINPENKCYCNGECVPSGTYNISSCRNGSPAFLSLPHFLNADHYYLDLVEGLQPNRSVHELFVIIEPITGIPLLSRVRLQLNLLLHPIPHTVYENAPRVFMPMLWFEQRLQIPRFILIVAGLGGIILIGCKSRTAARFNRKTNDYLYGEQCIPLKSR